MYNCSLLFVRWFFYENKTRIIYDDIIRMNRKTCITCEMIRYFNQNLIFYFNQTESKILSEIRNIYFAKCSIRY